MGRRHHKSASDDDHWRFDQECYYFIVIACLLQNITGQSADDCRDGQHCFQRWFFENENGGDFGSQSNDNQKSNAVGTNRIKLIF